MSTVLYYCTFWWCVKHNNNYNKGHVRESTHLRYTKHKGIVVMLSPAQWCSSVQLLPVCACLHGSYLRYMTDYNFVPCWSVVNAVTV